MTKVSRVVNSYAGVPADLLPEHSSWRKPVGGLTEFPNREEMSGFTGNAAWFGLGGSATKVTERYLGTLSNLEYLVIRGVTVPDAILDGVSTLTRLKRLDLSPIRRSNLAFLGELKQLEYLFIESVPSNTDLSEWIHRPSLVSLGLGLKQNSVCLPSSEFLPRLECLLIQRASSYSTKTLINLKGASLLPQLRYVVLLGFRPADSVIAELARSTSLEVIVLSKVDYVSAASHKLLAERKIVLNEVAI